MKRFSVYLLREVVPLYIAGVAVLVLLLLILALINGLADFIARGVPLPLVAQFLLYQLPVAAGRGIPLALLFAALLGLSRLSQDAEIKAALVLGLGPGRFALPVLLTGLVVSALSFINNEALIPWSQQRVLDVQKEIFLTSPSTLLEEGSFFTDALGRSIFIESLEPGGVFENVVVIQPGGSQGPKEVISAGAGRLDDARGVWTLADLRMRVYRRSRLVLATVAEAGELPTRGLSAGSPGPGDLAYLPIQELVTRIRSGESGRRSAEWTALHRKAAEPLAAAAFALFALAVTLFTFQRGTPLGLVSVLFLTFVYYATWSVTKLLGAQGTLPAWIAGWTPVALYAVVGGALLALSWRR